MPTRPHGSAFPDFVVRHGRRRAAAALTRMPGHALSDAEYYAVVDAVERWRAFGMEIVEVFEQQYGRADPAYQGALRMVVLADQVLRILRREDDG